MPKVTVYIRNEDIDKWKSIEHKTLFIHNALNEQKVTVPFHVKPPKFIIPDQIKHKEDLKPLEQNIGYMSKAYSARKPKK